MLSSVVDYHFLEDVLQSKQGARRILNRALGGERKNKHDAPTDLRRRTIALQPEQDLKNFSPAVRRLAKAARCRLTNMIMMPPGMSKRSLNATHHIAKTDIIMWHLHFVFVTSTVPVKPQNLTRMALHSKPSKSAATMENGVVDMHGEGMVGVALCDVSENTVLGTVIEEILASQLVRVKYDGFFILTFALRIRICQHDFHFEIFGKIVRV